jgi:phosphoribosylglycinamide formyltransferase 1
LQKRVLEKEHEILPKVIDLISKNKVEIINGKTRIK